MTNTYLLKRIPFFGLVFMILISLGTPALAQPDSHFDRGRHLGWFKDHHKHHHNDEGDDDDDNSSDSTHHGSDTTKHHQNPADSTKGDHDADDSVKVTPGGGQNRAHNPFGLSDSCFAYFLTLIPADTATLIKNDLAMIDSNGVRLDSLVAEWRREKKSKDTTVSDSMKVVIEDSLRTLIDSLARQTADIGMQVVELGRAEIDILTTVRMTCGDDNDTTKTHHGIAAPLIDVDVSAVSPNPISSGASAQFKISSDATTNIDVGLYDIMGVLVKDLYKGQIQAGVAISLSFDVDSLQPGAYILRVQTDSLTESQNVIVK